MSAATWALWALMAAELATVRISPARMAMMEIAINSSSSVKASRGELIVRDGRGAA